MAVYVKRSGTWLPSDGEAISLENSCSYFCQYPAYVGYNPGVEGVEYGESGTSGGWNNCGFLGGGGLGAQWTRDQGAIDARYYPGPNGPWGLFKMPKAGVWMISASAQWESTALSPFFMRAESFGVIGQATAVAYPRTSSGLATINLDFMHEFDQDQLWGIKACVLAGPAYPGHILSNIKVRMHWLSHGYA